MNNYQKRANETADYPQSTDKEALTYVVTGLCGEVGEIANKFKKFLRGDFELTEEVKNDLASELGDVLWYVSEFALQLDYSLQQIADNNIKKLSERKLLGTIKGNGEGNRIVQSAFSTMVRIDENINIKKKDCLLNKCLYHDFKITSFPCTSCQDSDKFVDKDSVCNVCDFKNTESTKYPCAVCSDDHNLFRTKKG
jgi:NTP pyrophosphatase (non-canonical NTP hydrolase)